MNHEVEQLIAYYQPIVDLNNECVVACEALARHKADSERVVAPVQLLDQLERDVELAAELTCHMLEITLSDLDRLLKTKLKYVSVNFPAIIVGKNLIPKDLRTRALAKAEFYVTEITERQIVSNDGKQVAKTACEEYGIRVAIDDFGTGYSGLLQLLDLPINIIKIDKAFVAGVGHNRTSERLIRGMSALAASLGVRTVAEGVETKDQFAFLRGAGIDYGQGWLWSKALPIDEFVEFAQLANAGIPEPNVQQTA